VTGKKARDPPKVTPLTTVLPDPVDQSVPTLQTSIANTNFNPRNKRFGETPNQKYYRKPFSNLITINTIPPPSNDGNQTIPSRRGRGRGFSMDTKPFPLVLPQDKWFAGAQDESSSSPSRERLKVSGKFSRFECDSSDSEDDDDVGGQHSSDSSSTGSSSSRERDDSDGAAPSREWSMDDDTRDSLTAVKQENHDPKKEDGPATPEPSNDISPRQSSPGKEEEEETPSTTSSLLLPEESSVPKLLDLIPEIKENDDDEEDIVPDGKLDSLDDLTETEIAAKDSSWRKIRDRGTKSNCDSRERTQSFSDEENVKSHGSVNERKINNLQNTSGYSSDNDRLRDNCVKGHDDNNGKHHQTNNGNNLHKEKARHKNDSSHGKHKKKRKKSKHRHRKEKKRHSSHEKQQSCDEVNENSVTKKQNEVPGSSIIINKTVDLRDELRRRRPPAVNAVGSPRKVGNADGDSSSEVGRIKSVLNVVRVEQMDEGPAAERSVHGRTFRVSKSSGLDRAGRKEEDRSSSPHVWSNIGSAQRSNASSEDDEDAPDDKRRRILVLDKKGTGMNITVQGESSSTPNNRLPVRLRLGLPLAGKMAGGDNRNSRTGGNSQHQRRNTKRDTARRKRDREARFAEDKPQSVNSPDGKTGEIELDVKIRRIMQRNAARAKRRQEIEADRQQYG